MREYEWEWVCGWIGGCGCECECGCVCVLVGRGGVGWGVFCSICVVGVDREDIICFHGKFRNQLQVETTCERSVLMVTSLLIYCRK